MPKKSVLHVVLKPFGKMVLNPDDRDINARFVDTFLFVDIVRKIVG